MSAPLGAMVPGAGWRFKLVVFTASAFLGQAVLPAGPLIIGYQDWGVCQEAATLKAVRDGVNVVIWSALNLTKSRSTGKPMIQSPVDPNCVARVRQALEAQGLPTTHLASIGGWDMPHPDTSFSGKEWFEAFREWNDAQPMPYEGIDWDLEGNDDLSSPYNTFAREVLDLVVDMSVEAKASGMTVSLVPPQSYFDQTTEGFSRSLTNAYDDWHPEFHYRGINCYAYIFAVAPPGTFDFVSLQLYETWSKAGQALIQKGQEPAEYLKRLAADLLTGWTVDFGRDPLLRVQGRHAIKLAPEQLVIALSFGSKDGRSVFFLPQDVGKAYEAAPAGVRPRGYAFWNIELDGKPANGTQTVCNLTAGLNEFLHIRVKPEQVTVV